MSRWPSSRNVARLASTVRSAKDESAMTAPDLVDPRYLRDFVALRRALTEEEYLLRWGFPALVVHTIVGELAPNKIPRRRTHPMLGAVEYAPVQSLVERVWLLRRTNVERPDSHVLVGQGAECDVWIPEYTLSSHHCAFSTTDAPEVQDLGSLNGTKIDGVPLRPRHWHRLKSGSTVALARLVFVYYSAGGFAKALDEFA